METNNRPLHVKQVHPQDQIQNGDGTVGSFIHPSGGLDVFHRLTGRLSPSANEPGESKIPPFFNPEGELSVQSLMLRFINSTSGVYQSDGSGSEHFALPRYTYSTLPRRLVNPSILRGGLYSSEGYSIKSLRRIRDSCKFQEVPSCTFPVRHVPGHRYFLHSFEGFTHSETSEFADVNYRRISVIRDSTSVSLEVSVRSPVISDTTYKGRSSQDEIPSNPAEESLEFSRRSRFGSLEPVMSRRSPVVASGGSSVRRNLSPVSCPRPDVLVRRIGSGMGRLSSLRGSFRPLVVTRKIVVDQQARAEGRISRPSSFRTSPGACRGNLLRQFHGRRLSEESRRYSLGVPQPGSSGDPALGGGEGDHLGSSIHSRIRERGGRSTLSKESSDGFRVDLTSRGLQRPQEGVACKYRPFCDRPKLSLSSILCSFERLPVTSHGCFSPVMGKPVGLRLSSVLPGEASPQQDEGIPRFDFNSNRSVLASERVVPGSPGIPSGATHSVTRTERSSQTTAFSPLSPEPPVASSSCLATIRRFARHEGFSNRVARQLCFARRRSTRKLYQHKWDIYRKWCHSKGHSISRPSIPKVADFLLFLHSKKRLSISTIKGYKAMLSAVFKLKIPLISNSPVLRDLLRSFEIVRPVRALRPPLWDVLKVLDSLRKPPFEPLESVPFRELTRKVLFLVSLATAKRVGELQALSHKVASNKEGMVLSYLPEFVAKTESISNPLPRSFVLKSLKDFVGDLKEELLLCPVRALSIYLSRRKNIEVRPRSLFVSPRCRQRSLSKNAISFFLRSVISDSGAVGSDEGPGPRAHSVRSVATSLTFHKNWSVSKVLEAATWRSQSVFTSFYLRDVASSLGDIRLLGPIVSAGEVLTSS